MNPDQSFVGSPSKQPSESLKIHRSLIRFESILDLKEASSLRTANTLEEELSPATADDFAFFTTDIPLPASAKTPPLDPLQAFFPYETELIDVSQLGSTAIISPHLSAQPAKPIPQAHAVSWSVATEQGYRNIGIYNSSVSPQRQPIHSVMEDIHWPTSNEHPTISVANPLPQPSLTFDPLFQPAGSQPSASSRTPSHSGLPPMPPLPQCPFPSRTSSRQSVGFSSSSSSSSSSAASSFREHFQAQLAPQTSLFILADGHGGVDAARFFVSRARELVTQLLQSQPWNFELASDRTYFESCVGTIFQSMDTEFCKTKIEEYRKWIELYSPELPKETRPIDDGCTLVVNVIHGGWLVNCNVGDSRTIVITSSPQKSARTEPSFLMPSFPQRLPSPSPTNASGWSPIFASDDHNMTHPEKLFHIYKNGGEFVTSAGVLRQVEIIDPTSVSATGQPQRRIYTELNGSRIYRRLTPEIQRVGVSNRRTLNLTATMGDLVFKVEPAVLSVQPDVDFVRLQSDQDYVVIVATDGVWDHMRVQGEGGNHAIAEYIGSRINSWNELKQRHAAQSSIDISRLRMRSDDALSRPPAISSAIPSVIQTTLSSLINPLTPTPSPSPPPSPSQGQSADNVPSNPSSVKTWCKVESPLQEPEEPLPPLPPLQELLSELAQSLVSRESATHNTGLFILRQIRYDDATSFLIHLGANK
ncbi:phosphatase 2C-like domain-containing protein [Polychytrium aggregatum]|uniref:phosphatase 2C-like domain-containing protein n=1 Tax=Polychytrium aggregatum TaxID=110093 RepID=UPI0022FE1038|nr:phosphatase 2C-like domain-containing protein [Polychytrium aggregatum]KAI9209340.1 phosphatase 2C-like domain-containing protein [Polychytrium aggregatum]